MIPARVGNFLALILKPGSLALHELSGSKLDFFAQTCPTRFYFSSFGRAMSKIISNLLITNGLQSSTIGKLSLKSLVFLNEIFIQHLLGSKLNSFLKF